MEHYFLALTDNTAERFITEYHQSISCAVKFGTLSQQTKRVFAPIVQRHPPHIPVPSIMMVLRLAKVLTPNGAVVLVQNFIMMAGPIVQTQPISRVSSSSFSGSVTIALRPKVPSSVQTMCSSQIAAILSTQKSRSFVRDP